MLKIFSPHKDHIIYGITSVLDGSFNDEENDGFEANLAALMKDYDMARPVYAKQIHSDIILSLNEAPKERPEADAFITSKRDLPLMIKVADCQGVLIYDPLLQVIAAVHSGWRGSIQNIIGKTIAQMEQDYGCDPKNLLVSISPSLGPCCSEFTDPTAELPSFCKMYTEGRHVDFWAMSLDQCQEAGVPKKNVEIARICTKDSPAHYSHRRSGDGGRIAVFIGLR